MNESRSKSFDCVQTMRRIRDRLSNEIAGMNHEEIIRWLRSQRYSDPFLQRLADKAAQQGDLPAPAAHRGSSPRNPSG